MRYTHVLRKQAEAKKEELRQLVGYHSYHKRTHTHAHIHTLVLVDACIRCPCGVDTASHMSLSTNTLLCGHQLRLRYRVLIESADWMVSMKELSETALANLEQVAKGVRHLEDSRAEGLDCALPLRRSRGSDPLRASIISTAAAAGGGDRDSMGITDGVRGLEEVGGDEHWLERLGLRGLSSPSSPSSSFVLAASSVNRAVQFVVDAPEQVWRHMESRACMRAAELYYQALGVRECVSRHLHQADGVGLAQSGLSTLLSQHSYTLDTCPQLISRQCRRQLRVRRLRLRDSLDSVCAMWLLGPHALPQLTQCFFDCRTQWVVHRLRVMCVML